MKLRITVWLFLCVLSIGAFAQSGKKKTIATTFKGTMTNAPRGFFIFEILGQRDTVKLNKEGQFELSIEQHSANYFSIESNRQELNFYLLPYDTVTLTLNGSNLIDVKDVKGKSAPYINHLVKKQRADRMFQTKVNQSLASGLAADGFYNNVDSVRKERLNALETDKALFIEPFIESESKAAGYQMANQLMAYKSQNNKEGKGVFPASFDTYINKQNLNDENISYLKEYTSFLQNFVSQKALARYYADPQRSVLMYYEAVVDEVCKNITSEKTKSILLSELMPQIMKEVGTQDLTKLIARLESCSKDEKLIQSVKNFAAQYEHLYPGKPAPDAAAYDLAGKNYKLSDFKGKAVYIDVWATWCGPCKREIPHLKTLEAEYHGKNVEFISISTDKDINAWKKFLESQEMSGLQLHQSDNPDENMSYLYMVNSIPRFIVIDKNGRIVSSDAPRPSSGEQVRNMLNQLLVN